MEIQFGYSDEICYVICPCLSYEQYSDEICCDLSVFLMDNTYI